jgi:hypothetical protein
MKTSGMRGLSGQLERGLMAQYHRFRGLRSAVRQKPSKWIQLGALEAKLRTAECTR